MTPGAPTQARPAEGVRPEGVGRWRPGRDRLVGVDVARCLALVGMMAVHLLPMDGWHGPSLAARLTQGNASALFCILAGLSLVLLARATEGAAPRDGVRTAILSRAAILAVWGITLASLSSGVAVILLPYAVLFVLGAAVVGWSARSLAVAAAIWCIAGPVTSHIIRHELFPFRGHQPRWQDLGGVEQNLAEVMFTGYYPVWTWVIFLLAGMAIGKLGRRLLEPRVAGLLAGGGALVAGTSLLISSVLVHQAVAGGYLVPERQHLVGRLPLERALTVGPYYGTTPTSSWWWLSVALPHSGTPFEFARAGGIAVAVLGATLLATRFVPRWFLVVPAGMGAMTLTLYSLHVVGNGFLDFFGHVLIAAIIGTTFACLGWRGPLEALMHRVTRAVTPAAPATLANAAVPADAAGTAGAQSK